MIYSLVILLSQFWTSLFIVMDREAPGVLQSMGSQRVGHDWGTRQQHCSTSASNCCLLTCIQISHEAGKVVRYSHLFRNFPQLVVIHTVKGFSIVNEAEVDVFLEFPCFLYDPKSVGNLISGSPAFSKPSLYIWKFSVHVLLKFSLKDFEHNLASMWNKHNCMVTWKFSGISLLWIGMKTDLLQSCGYCWVFQICWHIECCTLAAASFRIWNSSAGIPSP